MNRGDIISESFVHFMENEWIFSTKKIWDLNKFLTPNEREIYQLDIKKVEWPIYLQYFCWGLSKYILKENNDAPSDVSRFFFYLLIIILL